jgi:effector-binding domain-containing protein/ribosome-associated toxin RatA of RatAB toxin-antitoxin module
MKALKYILFLILIIIIGLTIYIAVQPNSFEVKRTRTFNAPAEVIYNNVIDFKNWEAWSSWVEKDPETVITLGENTKGVGGSFSWVDKDGKGQMKTLSTSENVSIDQELQFGDFAPSKIHWEFIPAEDSKTEVVWKMNSDNVPFMFKAFALFSGGFDNMIGPDFERGLEKLDSIVEASMKIYSIKVDGITQHGGGFYLYNTTSTKMDGFENVMQDMLLKVKSYVQDNHITTAGPPFIFYHKWDETNNSVMFSSCVPTTAQVITTENDILTGQLEPFKAIKTTLTGNYSNLKEAWQTALDYIPKNSFEFTEQGPMLEVYVTDLTKTPNPANWITEIYIAVKEQEALK